MILIISDAFDAHADLVVQKLVAVGARYFRLNLDVDSLIRTYVTCRSGLWRISSPDGSIAGSDLSVVWCRRSTVSLNSDQQSDQSNGFRLWRAEWNRILFGLYNSLSSAFWLNAIRPATLADNKFYQYCVANSCGFQLPDTITSNCKNELEEFAQKHDQVALKFMSQEMYKGDHGATLGLYVNKVDQDGLESFQGFGENPITLQRYVQKDFEVRYTFVDGDHLVCKIESQKSKIASTDWRRYDVKNTPHYAMNVGIEIKSKVEDLMDRLDLRFGALDFIVDPEGVWWFLEVNSAGQWLWIEDLSGLRISDRITLCLIRHSNGARS